MNKPYRRITNGATLTDAGYFNHCTGATYFYGLHGLYNRIDKETIMRMVEPIRSELLSAAKWIDREAEVDRMRAHREWI